MSTPPRSTSSSPGSQFPASSAEADEWGQPGGTERSSALPVVIEGDLAASGHERDRPLAGLARRRLTGLARDVHRRAQLLGQLVDQEPLVHSPSLSPLGGTTKNSLQPWRLRAPTSCRTPPASRGCSPSRSRCRRRWWT